MDPAGQFHNSFKGIGNNPICYVDPDGEFIFGALLLSTDIGYDIQKYISPVALRINLPFGSHQNGIGFDISVGLPQIMPMSYRKEVGASYYFNRSGGYGAGWQARNGGEWGGLHGFVRYGGTNYRDFDKGGNLIVNQTVHRATLGTPLLQIQYQNDTEDSFPWADRIPLIPELEEGNIQGLTSDRYRTASGKARVGLFELGFQLHTGEAEAIRWVDTDGDGTLDARAFDGGDIGDSEKSNGIIYFGFAGFKMGWDSENIRHTLQNRMVHDGFFKDMRGTRYPWVPKTDKKPRFFFQFGEL